MTNTDCDTVGPTRGQSGIAPPLPAQVLKYLKWLPLPSPAISVGAVTALTVAAAGLFSVSAQAGSAQELFLFDDASPTQVNTISNGRQRFEIRSGYAIVEGDIVLGRIGNDPSGQQLILPRGIGRDSSFNLWMDGLVYYQFSDGLAQQELQKINAAIDHWNTRSTISLIERTDANADGIDSYIVFEPSGGCASWVGKIGGEQAIWVGPSCTAGSVIHEIGHAVGLFHEHTRTDRDAFLTVNWDNIVNDKDFNFDIIDAGANDIGDYDYGSIMHYGPSFFSRNGEPTLIVPDGVEIGQREALSALDLASVDAMYAVDLMLTASAATDGDYDVLLARINNLTENGAHNLVYTLPIGADASLIAASGEGWECSHSGSDVRCERGVLSGESETSLQLTLQRGQLNPANVTALLRSKSHDTDLSNNGYQVASPVTNGTNNADADNSDTSTAPEPADASTTTDTDADATPTESPDSSTTDSATPEPIGGETQGGNTSSPATAEVPSTPASPVPTGVGGSATPIEPMIGAGTDGTPITEAASESNGGIGGNPTGAARSGGGGSSLFWMPLLLIGAWLARRRRLTGF